MSRSGGKLPLSPPLSSFFFLDFDFAGTGFEREDFCYFWGQIGCVSSFTHLMIPAAGLFVTFTNLLGVMIPMAQEAARSSHAQNQGAGHLMKIPLRPTTQYLLAH